VTTRFENALGDQAAGFVHEPGSSTVLVACGGLARQVGMPPFEFFNLVSGFPVTKLFIRDLDAAFYHRGVRGLGTSIPEVAAAVRDLVSGAQRLVVVGASAGGYGAIVFGSLLSADAVMAFAPITFLSSRLRRRHRDTRWAEEVATAHASPGLARQYLDLRKALRSREGATRIDLYYPARNRLDTCHAQHLRRVRVVTLHPIPSRQHGVIRELRDDGTLRRLLLEALALP
jgi:hypothetical protein